MTSITLAESALLSQNTLVSGIIETVVTTNQFFQVLPFDEIEGNALAYDREVSVDLSGWFTVGDTISGAAKAAQTVTQATASLTTLIGDAEVNGLIQATRSNINDQKAVQVAAKAKSVGRKYQDALVNGDGTNNVITGLRSLVAAGQTINAGATADGVTTNGGPFTFELLDELLDKVQDKDGQVDFLLVHSRELRKYFKLLRALGGATIGDVVTLPDGSKVPAYRNTPLFRCDFIPTNITRGSSTNCSVVIAGNLDDGSRKIGIAGLTARGAAGIRVSEVGEMEAKDETITRVKWYAGLANFSQLGLAMAQYVTPSVA